jgi:redox-sensitive bicupin YhaK (pirin superfamily)
MWYVFHPASWRGVADYGWLQANYSFSFARYYNDAMMGFGVLRVLNDDTIAGGKWFPPHGHDNMEIITIPQAWALEHNDNTGWHGIIRVGDVQVMSAGSGVDHSEYNASATESATLFQLWIDSKETDITPRYDQKSFGVIPMGEIRLLVSNDGREGSLMIYQDAFVSRGSVWTGKTLTYRPYISTNGVYIMLVSGGVVVEEQVLWPKDALGVWGEESIMLSAQEDSDVLFIEVPMK